MLTILVFVLALTPHLLMIGSPYTTNVAGAYLLDGLRLYHGRPPQETQHGPLYAMLVFLVFKVSGVSIVGAAVLVKVSLVFGIVAFFLFLEELFGKWTAFFASCLVIVSKLIYYELGLHIYLDALVLALEFWFLVFMVRAVKQSRTIHFALAGLFLGLALLSKENALFLLPFPVLAVWCTRQIGNKKVGQGLALLYGLFFLTMLPWLIFLQLRGQGTTAILGWLTPTYRNLRDWGVFLEGKTLWENLWIYNPIVALWHLFGDRIFVTELFGRLYPITILWIVGKSLWFRKETDMLLTLALACSLPLAVITGAFGDRLGHMPEFLFLMHATLPVCLGGIREVLAQNQQFSSGSFSRAKGLLLRTWKSVAIGAAIVVLLLVPSRPESLPELGFGIGAKPRWFGREVVETLAVYRRALAEARLPSSGWSVRSIAGRHTADLEKSGKWLMENTPVGGFIITDGVYDDPVRFFTHMRWPVVTALYPRFTPLTVLTESEGGARVVRDLETVTRKGRALLITNTPGKFRSRYYRYRSLLLTFEDDFQDWLRLISRPEARIVFHKEAKNHIADIDEVLLHSGLFAQVYKQGVVSILRPSGAAGEVMGSFMMVPEQHLDPRLLEDLQWLRMNYPSEFQLFIEVLEKSKSFSLLAELGKYFVVSSPSWDEFWESKK